jgi:hypothetical protein
MRDFDLEDLDSGKSQGEVFECRTGKAVAWIESDDDRVVAQLCLILCHAPTVQEGKGTQP